MPTKLTWLQFYIFMMIISFAFVRFVSFFFFELVYSSFFCAFAVHVRCQHFTRNSNNICMFFFVYDVRFLNCAFLFYFWFRGEKSARSMCRKKIHSVSQSSFRSELPHHFWYSFYSISYTIFACSRNVCFHSMWRHAWKKNHHINLSDKMYS